jgi:hypothetical protein
MQCIAFTVTLSVLENLGQGVLQMVSVSRLGCYAKRMGSRVILLILKYVASPENHVVYFDNFFTSQNLLHHVRNLK